MSLLLAQRNPRFLQDDRKSKQYSLPPCVHTAGAHTFYCFMVPYSRDSEIMPPTLRTASSHVRIADLPSNPATRHTISKMFWHSGIDLKKDLSRLDNMFLPFTLPSSLLFFSSWLSISSSEEEEEVPVFSETPP